MPAESTGLSLLLDEAVVAEVRDCRQTFHAPVKDPSSPVITATEPWEGRGPYTWGTRLLWNPERQQYDLYYVGFRVEDNHYRWGLAESRDGLTWTKPDLAIESFGGAPARNMLTGGPHPDKAVRSVVRDPRLDCPPDQRYKAIRFTYEGECVSYSPDGWRWTEAPGNPVWRVPSDIIHTLWDPGCNRFVAYFKLWELCGETPAPSSPSGWRPVRKYLPFFSHRPGPEGLTEIREGIEVLFDPEAGARTQPVEGLLLRAADQGMDDGGGAPLTGAWHARRVIARAESEDFCRWRREELVLCADERDRPDANIQYLFVLPYGGYYLGFATLHDERGHFEQQLAFSRDGRCWSRPWRGNFIGLGPPGAFDSGMVLAPTDPIATDTQLIFYYGGFDIQHWQPMSGPWSAAIGRAFMRRDGFASWDSLPGRIGMVETQPLQVAGEDLWLNAEARAGRLRVEVRDESGRVIPGFSQEDCTPLNEDTSRYSQCLAPIRWAERKLGALVGWRVRLRFALEESSLFALRLGEG
ncbi:MAG: hypothetical protein HYW07_24260 [Candidatus Latescibacteria bacterium]|nr:hypothetical protein [Candidatus Latescibacterota bacterium]